MEDCKEGKKKRREGEKERNKEKEKHLKEEKPYVVLTLPMKRKIVMVKRNLAVH